VGESEGGEEIFGQEEVVERRGGELGKGISIEWVY
jgi:hypothetical protein